MVSQVRPSLEVADQTIKRLKLGILREAQAQFIRLTLSTRLVRLIHLALFIPQARPTRLARPIHLALFIPQARLTRLARFIRLVRFIPQVLSIHRAQFIASLSTQQPAQYIAARLIIRHRAITAHQISVFRLIWEVEDLEVADLEIAEFRALDSQIEVSQIVGFRTVALAIVDAISDGIFVVKIPDLNQKTIFRTSLFRSEVFYFRRA